MTGTRAYFSSDDATAIYKYLLLALQAQAQTSAHTDKFFSTEDHVSGASEVSREHPSSRLLFCSLSGPSEI